MSQIWFARPSQHFLVETGEKRKGKGGGGLCLPRVITSNNSSYVGGGELT